MQFCQIDPIHPGEVLKADFLEVYGIAVTKAAADIGVNAGRLNEVIVGHAPVNADLALRLSRYFETSPEFWLNLQRAYDLSLAVKSAHDIEKIRPVSAGQRTASLSHAHGATRNAVTPDKLR